MIFNLPYNRAIVATNQLNTLLTPEQDQGLRKKLLLTKSDGNLDLKIHAIFIGKAFQKEATIYFSRGVVFTCLGVICKISSHFQKACSWTSIALFTLAFVCLIFSLASYNTYRNCDPDQLMLTLNSNIQEIKSKNSFFKLITDTQHKATTIENEELRQDVLDILHSLLPNNLTESYYNLDNQAV